MSMVVIRLEQTIPFFGKTDQRENVAREAVEGKRWELEERKNELVRSIRSTYHNLGLARQLEKLTARHVSLVEQLIDAVRVKHRDDLPER